MVNLPNGPAMLCSVHSVHFQMDFWPALDTAAHKVNVDRMAEDRLGFATVATRYRFTFDRTFHALPI